MIRRMYVLTLAVTMMVMGAFFTIPATAQAEVVVPDGWVYELFADVDGIQYVSGPSSSRCPVGAYTTSVDEQGNVYFATSSCNTGYYWIIRVEPDGSAWDKFGNQRVRDLDGVYAHTLNGETAVYGCGGSGISRFNGDGIRTGIYGGVYGNAQQCTANSKGEMFVSTISRGIYKINPETGAATRFQPYLNNGVLYIDKDDNIYTNNSGRILRIAPDGSYTVIRQGAGVTSVHPSGDLYVSSGGKLERMYENPDGTWSWEVFAEGISGSMAWSADGERLYVSKGVERTIYVLYRKSIDATVDIDPDVLNLRSNGRYITAYIELPEGYDVDDIFINTVELGGEVLAEVRPTVIGDHDGDGIFDLMVKFDRATVQAIVSEGDEVEMTVTGELIDGTSFEGMDIIRVSNPGR